MFKFAVVTDQEYLIAAGCRWRAGGGGGGGGGSNCGGGGGGSSCVWQYCTPRDS